MNCQNEKGMNRTDNKLRSKMSIPASLMGELRKGCLSARTNLFSDAVKGFDYDELRFASLEDTISEEDRVNAFTNNKVKFTFGHKDYLQFQLAGCDMIFQPQGKNPYDKVDKAVNEAIEQYNKMTELYQQMKEDETIQGITSTSFMLSKLNVEGIEHCIDVILATVQDYHLALYLQEARDYFNKQLELAFGEESYTVKIGATENSRLYLTDNAVRKKTKRVLLRGEYEQARKYLSEGISTFYSNKNKTKIMKKEKITKAAGQEVVKQQERENESVNFNVAQVANLLTTLLHPESESSRLLSVAKIDIATWLSNSTDGVMTCSLNEGLLTLANKVSNVSVSIPVNNTDEYGMETKITSALDYLVKTMQFVCPKGVCTPDNGEQETSKTDHNITAKKSESKLKQKVNALFLKEKDKLRDMLLKDSVSKHRRQTLWGQLYSICNQCGYKGSRSKKKLVPLLDENNKKVFDEMYNLAA